MAKFVNLLLLLLLVGGAVRLLVQSSTLKILTAEHGRLVGMHGELDVKDASKFLVTSVDTGDPMHFKWRIYYPAGVTMEERFQDCGTTDLVSLTARESVYQVRFEFRHEQLRIHAIREKEDGVLLGGCFSLGHTL